MVQEPRPLPVFSQVMVPRLPTVLTNRHNKAMAYNHLHSKVMAYINLNSKVMACINHNQVMVLFSRDITPVIIKGYVQALPVNIIQILSKLVLY